jgi:hypothetical protein
MDVEAPKDMLPSLATAQALCANGVNCMVPHGDQLTQRAATGHPGADTARRGAASGWPQWRTQDKTGGGYTSNFFCTIPNCEKSL